MFTFKKKQIEIEGQKLDITELSAGGFRRFTSAVKDNPDDEVLQMAVLIASSVDQFKGKSLDDVMDSINVAAMGLIVPHIIELSGIDQGDDDEKKTRSYSFPI